MNPKISVFVICDEVIIYSLLCNFHDCTIYDSLYDNSQNPDVNFFTTMSLPLKQIIFHQLILVGILKISRKMHSVLHLNIRNLNRNFESFAKLHKSLHFT